MKADPRDREDLAAFLLGLRTARLGGQRFLEAVESVPRRLFVPASLPNAYDDRSAPIECGETIHGALFQAGLVAALELESHHRVLEIGTGTGYMTALCARLSAHVTSFERYRRLLNDATKRLREVGIGNVALVLEDGREGHPSGGPYDRVIVHAAFAALPKVFLDQMNPNAAMICAIGPGNGEQALVRLRKTGSRFEQEELGKAHYQALAAGTAAVL
ncbi:protein-L-isoaspartate(D-aspartate) O-methyltransferase [Aurantimonas sp. Leaf443]|uniref:protein-L-isoaspartate(D-aspartate) O-methyltransferase n=1 Tax=Aurantimonas sp. Leaf443 TaxID=1736378 RepID=UPI000701D7E1|nr:protein-L-isoaspartate(D-aspartate) O-methyltransferase [Aurantimonas sp. Leaf443]KQT82554.1 hypothetical protein ASG48_15940 [Aurantimonas sp. Leaf443]